MENSSRISKNRFYGVSLFNKKNVVSVVSEEYYQKIKTDAPDFYSEFQFAEFHSSKTLTELNKNLPFRIVRDNGVDCIETFAKDRLLESEREHLEIHHEILKIYQDYRLEPNPPWVYTATGCAAASSLEDCLLRLRRSTPYGARLHSKIE